MAILKGSSSLFCLLLVSALVHTTAALTMSYCASINTASTSANSSIYQSDGLCHDFCVDSYAYAIVQENSCWCSDYTPDSDTQVATSKCNTACPGYPSDTCGGSGLYGYIALDKSAAGTKGSSSSSASSTSSSKPDTTSTTSTKTSTSTSSTITPAPSPTVQTVTAGGTVQTVTVTPSSGATASSSETTTTSKKSKGLSTGAAVGVAVGVVAAVVFAAIVVFCLWRRRRQQHEAESDALFASTKSPSPRGGSPGASNSPLVTQLPAVPAFTKRPGDGSWDSEQSGRRRSALMPIDPRMDPAFGGIYSRSDNKSRDSINSLRDDNDYSRRVHQPNRVLRATNPDPDDD